MTKIMWKLRVNPGPNDIPRKVIITRETEHNYFWRHSEDTPEIRVKKGGHYSDQFFKPGAEIVFISEFIYAT